MAEVLGYSDTSDAIKKHVDEEDKMGRQIADSLGRLQNTKIINESGLYKNGSITSVIPFCFLNYFAKSQFNEIIGIFYTVN